MEYIYLVVGLFLGILLSALYLRGTISSLRENLRNLTDQASALSKDLEKKSADFDLLQKDNAQLGRDNASLEEKIKAGERQYQQSLDDQEKRFKEMIQTFKEQIHTDAGEILKAKEKDLKETNAENIGSIITPLKEAMEQLKKEMSQNTKSQSSLETSMRHSLETMMKENEKTRSSADKLSAAFELGSKCTGDWGEMVLRNVLESSGLKEGIHFDTQVTLKDERGKTLRSESGSEMRPDVILHLDKEKEVIIDSKASIKDYLDYSNAKDDESRESFMRAHISSLKKHVKELSNKDYSKYILPPKVKMDYVIMFVPNSGALWDALTHEPTLWRDAMDKNVFIADEQTLFAALRIIEKTWVQIAQHEQQEKVFSLAKEVVERVGMFYEEYESVGKALENATRSYKKGNAKLLDSGQSIIVSARKLEKIAGGKNSKHPLPSISDNLLEE